MRDMRLAAIGLSVSLLFPTLPSAPAASAQQSEWSWYEVDAQGKVRLNLYLFWSQSCSHCPPALNFCDWLRRALPWVNVHTYEISGNAANRDLYRRMAASLKQIGGQTPAFFCCNQMILGYGSYEQTGKRIEQNLVRWYEHLSDHYRRHPPGAAEGVAGLLTLLTPPEGPPNPALPPPPPIDLPPPVAETVQVPGWGEVQAESLSLPAFTLVIAGCDAFNPCAFFVLLLLLSLLIHGRSRFRMLLVGGVFVFFSGLMYFLFMAAWLNLFFVIGHLSAITLAAGALAVGAGLLNVKDYFWFKQGPSLSIPDGARPGLIRRMNRLLQVSGLPALLGGAAALATVANLYELLCTSGFPMIYTRVLTLRQLEPIEYYGYLLLYNAIYVAPMALIVAVFAWTLGAWKLTETGGRILKLLSGLMMLGLGIVLLVRPTLLHSPLGAVGLLAAAGAATALVVAVSTWRHRPRKKEPTPADSLRTPTGAGAC